MEDQRVALLAKEKEELADEVLRLRHYIEEREKQWQQDKYAAVCLENMYQFVGLCDAEGKLVEANKPALTAGGLTFEEVFGQYLWTCHWWQTSEECVEKLRKATLECIHEKKFIRYEMQVYARKKGAEISTIDFSLLPVLDPTDGRVLYLVAEGRDIHEKKKIEAEIVRKNSELQKLYDRIKELDESKNVFIANISHELRTPLALILGLTEKLLDSDEAKTWTDDITRSLQIITDNANILLKHVNDLLDISKLEASEMTLQYDTVEMSNFIKRICSYFELLAASQKVTFDVSQIQRFSAQIDPNKFEKILLNLLSNAFKFTPQGGRISVSARRVVSSDKENPRGLFEISVEDSGPGVPADKRELIFERFRQIEGSANRTHGGTGLGLAIVKELAQLLGGGIIASESQLGGAAMKLNVPLFAPEGTQLSTNSPKNAKGLQNKITDFVKQTLADLNQHLQVVGTLKTVKSKLVNMDAIKKQAYSVSQGDPRSLVLVVEDNVSMNQFICDILRPEFDVISAANGQEGLEKAETYHPHCIISDIMMPLMSGEQMVNEIRNNPTLDTTPIMLLTAKADDSMKYGLLQGGVQEYLNKPFKTEDVLIRVRNLLSIRRGFVTLQEALNARNRDLAELLDDLADLFGLDTLMEKVAKHKVAEDV
jgi:PAS domain S-box-containing protein